MPSDDRTSPVRPSSHLRLTAATDLYVRFAAAEAVVLRRLRQLGATEAALLEAGITPPVRKPIHAPTPPVVPGQFAAEADRKRARSIDLVRKAIRRLKAGKCRSRSPSKAEIVEMSRHPDVDEEERGVSKNVFRTNQECLDLLLAACLPFDAERRRPTTTPAWVVRTPRKTLIDMVMAAERDRDQLTRELMAVNEMLIGPQIASIRKEVVRVKAQRMLTLAD